MVGNGRVVGGISVLGCEVVVLIDAGAGSVAGDCLRSLQETVVATFVVGLHMVWVLGELVVAETSC